MNTNYGTYCQTVCKARCCKRGKLPLLPKEKALFSQERIDHNDFYNLAGGCEHLDETICTIYDKRPQVCRSYPFHTMGPILIANTNCPAVEEGILDEEIEERKARKV